MFDVEKMIWHMFVGMALLVHFI